MSVKNPKPACDILPRGGIGVWIVAQSGSKVYTRGTFLGMLLREPILARDILRFVTSCDLCPTILSRATRVLRSRRSGS